jgi:hypothetical protein
MSSMRNHRLAADQGGLYEGAGLHEAGNAGGLYEGEAYDIAGSEYEGGFYNIAESERILDAAAVDIGAVAQGAVRPSPAAAIGFTFGTPVLQAAPAPARVAGNPSWMGHLFRLAIRPSPHRDDVIIDLLDWYTIDLGEKGPLIANFRCLAKIGAVFLRDVLHFITDLRIGPPRARS